MINSNLEIIQKINRLVDQIESKEYQLLCLKNEKEKLTNQLKEDSIQNNNS